MPFKVPGRGREKVNRGMINTVIGINTGMLRPQGRKDRMKYGKEIEEILVLVGQAKNRLGNVSVRMDAEDLDTATVDEAMDALDDVIDILEEAMEEE